MQRRPVAPARLRHVAPGQGHLSRQPQAYARWGLPSTDNYGVISSRSELDRGSTATQQVLPGRRAPGHGAGRLPLSDLGLRPTLAPATLPTMARFRPHRMYPGALLAQEACSYQGATEVLARIGGRLAVIIHSDRDCSNVVPKTRQLIQGDLPYKFLCTNLKEDELVTGQGGAKLRKALQLVGEAWQPALTVVLSTCPTVMIGDNLRNIAKKSGRELGMRVEAELTHGLRPVSPAEVVDKVFGLLARASQPTGVEVRRRVNLVGFDLGPNELAEIRDGLGELGLTQFT